AVSPRLVVKQHPISANREQAFRATAEDLAPLLSPEVEVLCTFVAPFDLKLTPHLRWVQAYLAGIDRFRDTQLWQSETLITGASGVHSVQIGEYVMGVLLALAHHFSATYRFQAAGRWPERKETYRLTTTELRGRTLGILGYGAIGREIARLASSFGMRILAMKRARSSASFDGWTPSGTGDPEGRFPERFYDPADLAQMLPHCDMLVLALPLTAQTHHIIGAAEFASLPSHACVVNIGRGPLIDYDALVAALEAHDIGGAALDVTEPEPLPSTSPLWQMENVLITPHIAGFSQYYDDRLADLFCANLRRYLAGEPLYNLVQRDQGY
ncbi:MAG TPA: D-2-hydroxyacid dehydrogenase, partial [Ktedonobacteraceae bacterium]|nr:D-2-hydroxyacid dehydrogenase [Ktedonobacteraceae bacterium]